jgi:plastocyanin
MRIGSRLLSALSVVALTATACGGSSDKKADTTTSSTVATSMIGGISAVLRGTSIAADGLEVEIDDNYFKPNVITGTPGQRVSLDLASEGKSLHNFSLTDQQISVDITAGSKATVKVVLPTSGDLVFFCKYHKDESGMVGALRVTP